MSLHGQNLRQMLSLRAPTGAIHSGRPSVPRDVVPASLGRRRLWVALALLAGYLLFCHGCHGDVDDELFVSSSTKDRQAGATHLAK